MSNNVSVHQLTYIRKNRNRKIDKKYDFFLKMYMPYDFLRVKSASESDSAVKKLEKKLFTPFFANLLFSDALTWGFQC